MYIVQHRLDLLSMNSPRDRIPSIASESPDVLLINPPYPRRFGGGVVPPIGLCYLAATLRQSGAQPAILDLVPDFPDYSFFKSEDPLIVLRQNLNTMKRKPTLIGIGPLVTASLRATHDIVKVCRQETSATIVVGGPLCAVPGISAVAANYLRSDYFVVGDGESPIAAIWRQNGSSVNSGGVGIAGHSEPCPFREHDLDSLPIPARDLLRSDLYRCSVRRDVGSGAMTAAFLSRGCPYSCTFCAAPLSSGKLIRRLSSSRITQEVAACARAGIDHIVFYDDCLFVKSPSLNRSVLGFAQAVEKARWKGTFQLELRCDAVTSLSDEAASALINVGCRQINMGIEKGHVVALDRLRKRLSPDIAREACEKVAALGLRVAGTFIIGGPDETPEDIENTIEFAISLPLDFAQFNPMAVYPGTQLFKQRFGDVSEWLHLCLDPDLAPLGDILWSSDETPLAVILEAVRDAYSRFYTSKRLERTSARLPENERSSVIHTYDVLLNDRARSWAVKNIRQAAIAKFAC